MSRLLQPLILAILLVISSCDTSWCKKDFSDRVLRYYKNQMSSFYGAAYEFTSKPSKPQDFLLQLTEVTPFDWDSMVWVNDSLESGEISKLIGTQYEGKDAYKGKQKLIFMNEGKIADIYALRNQDSITFIPGDVQHGSAKVSRDTWFTVRANDTAFVLKRFGVSDIYIPKAITENSLKKEPLFVINDENFTYGLSSDTVKSNRTGCRGGIDFNLYPLTRRMMKTIFTQEQLSYILKNNIFIAVTFLIYLDTGEIFECYWGIDEEYKYFFTEKQIREMSEFILGTRIDPRFIRLSDWDKCPSEKRVFVCWSINVRTSLLD